MAFYQTFPGQAGSSNSMEKLARLALPSLAAKSFLDVGCNAGYFCGYAFFEGASKVVGIDSNEQFIAMARNNFPQCNFIPGNWEDMEQLLNGACFDVILCASALHYAESQSALVEKMMNRLKDDGTLVLEMGMVDNPEMMSESMPGWHSVRRSIDERLFPDINGLEKMLKPWAYKIMGQSIPQMGDPIGRIVLHVRKRKKTAILLFGNPGSGKTEMARLFADKMKIIQGDILINELFRTPERFNLSDVIEARQINFQRIDKEIFNLFDSGKGAILAQAAASMANDEDFVYDGFIPRQFREIFSEYLEMLGFRIVAIQTPAPEFTPMALGRKARQEARKYEMFLTAMTSARKARKI